MPSLFSSWTQNLLFTAASSVGQTTSLHFLEEIQYKENRICVLPAAENLQLNIHNYIHSKHNFRSKYSIHPLPFRYFSIQAGNVFVKWKEPRHNMRPLNWPGFSNNVSLVILHLHHKIWWNCFVLIDQECWWNSAEIYKELHILLCDVGEQTRNQFLSLLFFFFFLI